jgi:hypothetical protein
MVLFLNGWFLVSDVPGQIYGSLQVHFVLIIGGDQPVLRGCWGVVQLHDPILYVWVAIGIVVH